jgi:lipoprotein-anchoring transpeptidase ErfK/SrfK
MVDYYSTLLRAVTAPGAGDAQWRRVVYERARQMLGQRLHAMRPAPPVREIASEEEALEEAIERIESELTWTEHAGAPSRDDAPAFEPEPEYVPDRGPIGLPRRRLSTGLIAIALVAVTFGAGGYLFWSSRPHRTDMTKDALKTAAAVKTETREAAPRQIASTAASINLATSDLAPGVDGGSSDRDLPYVYRRQPTFYRTLQPVGTVIVDKLQHFLYIVLPNNVAMRYGIAVGERCADLAGLRHIASMTDMPTWQPPPDLLKRSPPVMAGGPGNPLGSRLMELDDKTSSIHGTNAPKTIGNSVAFGCIRMVNDDAVDLSNRVKISTPVVVN